MRRHLHTFHEQVEHHRDFRDCAGDDDEGVNLLAEVGNQERREQIHDVADAPYDQHDAERLREQP